MKAKKINKTDRILENIVSVIKISCIIYFSILILRAVIKI